MARSVSRIPITTRTRGYIDDFRLTSERVATLRGWIFHETEPIECIDITLNDQRWADGLLLSDRPDVEAAYKSSLGQRPHLSRSGIHLTKPLPPGISDLTRSLITIVPSAPGGRKSDSFLTYYCPPGEQAEAPVPPKELQIRVGETDHFSVTRVNLTTLVMTQLYKHQRDLFSSRILDWGCGC